LGDEEGGPEEMKRKGKGLVGTDSDSEKSFIYFFFVEGAWGLAKEKRGIVEVFVRRNDLTLI